MGESSKESDMDRFDAVEQSDGSYIDKNNEITWYNVHEQMHREDGPAIERSDGDKFWYLNGELHREDGPAIEGGNGTKRWYLNGQEYSEEDFLKKTQPVKEMTIEDIEKQLGYTIKVVK